MFRNRRVILSEEEREERLREDFSQAYMAHGAGVLRYLLSAGMQTADAQDVLQNSFLAMWKLRTRIEDTTSLAPLWFTIARHKMYDLFRRNRRSVPFSAELEKIPDSRNDLRELDRTVLRRRIVEELRRLPEETAEAYRLTKISGLSIREAAGILGLSESDIKSKVFRARKKLMESLADWKDFTEN